MNLRSIFPFVRRRAAALALAGALVGAGASAASAQWLDWDNAMAPMQVERMLEARGYRLTAPVIRNGPVYLANVISREDERQRLVIDALDGHLLQRYAAVRPPAFSGEDWQPRAQAALPEGWQDRRGDLSPPRPPADLNGEAETELPNVLRTEPAPPLHARPGADAAPTPKPRPGADVARADDSSNPYVILAPPAAAPAPAPVEKPKPKPQVKHRARAASCRPTRA